MPNTKKFKLSFSLSSFHLCRPKNPSSFPKSPTPKTINISYPPPPPAPPSTPIPNFLIEKETPNKPRGNRKKKKNVIDCSSPEGMNYMKEVPPPPTTTKSPKNRKKVRIQRRRRSRMSDSYAMVVKTSSKDPHRDFKDSMMEMILEKHMFDAKELEQLLHCFLSLNSKHHVPAIVSAFTEVWETLFCKITPPLK